MAVLLPDVPKGLKIRLIGSNQARPWVNTLHATYTSGPPSVAELTTLAASISSFWNTSVAANLNNSSQLTTVEVMDISSRTGAIATDNTVRSGTGGSTSLLPVSIACCVSWKINRRYRGGHPRIYVPAAVMANVINGNTWLGTYLTAVQTAWRSMRTSINGAAGASAPYTLVNVSYYQAHQGYPNDLRPVPVVDTIQDAIVHTRIDSMRRRTGREVA